MVNAANMLLDVAPAPEQALVLGAGQVNRSQDPSNSPFLALMQDFIGSAGDAMTEQTTEPVRAGQQADEETQSAEGTELPSQNAITLADCLLGSVQIACSEVQALPTEAVTEAPVTGETEVTAVSSSTPQVAESNAQPTIAEQPSDGARAVVTAETTRIESPDVVQVAEAAEVVQPVPELTVHTDIPTRETGEARQSLQAGVEQPEQADQPDRPIEAVGQTQPQSRLSEADSEAPPGDRPSVKVVSPEVSERAEVPEYLRNIVPREGTPLGSKVIVGRDAWGVQPTNDVDPELAATPVERSAPKDRSSLQTEVRQGVPWTPIEVRPAVESAVTTATAAVQNQPVDQVERANIIHQIVRTARVHVFDGGGEMVMRLEPAHLGSIQMSVTAEQGIVTAQLKAGTESVRQALEAGLPALRESLAAAGIHVDAVSVSVGDSFSQGWNLHAGAHNGSQYTGDERNGYANNARSLHGEGDATSVDQPSLAHTGAGFNYLA